jgi:hypothetical protein
MLVVQNHVMVAVELTMDDRGGITRMGADRQIGANVTG